MPNYLLYMFNVSYAKFHWVISFLSISFMHKLSKRTGHYCLHCSKTHTFIPLLSRITIAVLVNYNVLFECHDVHISLYNSYDVLKAKHN